MSTLFDYHMHPLKDLTALVTGASSGIGEAIALALASQGVHLILTARRKDRLEALAKRIQTATSGLKVFTVVADITTQEGIQAIAKAGGFKTDILINNAGGALGKEPAAEASMQDWNTMIASNLTAAARVVHESLPHMLSNGGGDIITIASIAGHQTYEGGSMYCAVKHGIRAFCQSVREETCGRNVRIMMLSPGLVETEFSLVRFHGDAAKARSVYADMKPLTANDIAAQALFALQLPRHVCQDEILTLPTDQGSVTKVARHKAS